MIPTSFDESNTVLDRPKELTEEECQPLSVYVGNTPTGIPVIVSCWKLTKDEVDTLIKTGRLWHVIVGTVMQPVVLTVDPPFEKAEQ